MNPKLKAVLISILFFPLVLIGNIIGTFANMVFQLFYSFGIVPIIGINFDFSYGEPVIIRFNFRVCCCIWSNEDI